MTEKEFVTYLNTVVSKYPSVAAFCREKRLSQPYFGDILKSRKPVSQRVLDAVGYEQVVTYRKKKNV
jgi:hypothetical protein